MTRRKGTLRAFKWSGLDWATGAVSVLKQKGHRRLDAEEDHEEQGRPIFFVAPPDVLAVLHAWHEHLGRPPADSPFVRDLWTDEDSMQRENHDEAKVLRDDLLDSNVRREILFSKANNVQAIRFHDRRATFCTWAVRDGREDRWIRVRTGHAVRRQHDRPLRAHGADPWRTWTTSPSPT